MVGDTLVNCEGVRDGLLLDEIHVGVGVGVGQVGVLVHPSWVWRAAAEIVSLT